MPGAFGPVLGWRSVIMVVALHFCSGQCCQGCGELLLPSPRASGHEPSPEGIARTDRQSHCIGQTANFRKD